MQDSGAVDGIWYAANVDGTIAAIGQQSWDEAHKSYPTIGAAADILGQNIFSFIVGEEVVEIYRRFMHTILGGKKRLISFPFRCDTPSLRRTLTMSLSGIAGRRVLFQSVLTCESVRAPIKLFDVAYMRERRRRAATMPLVTICSYCQRLKLRATDGPWTSAEDYKADGGTDDVRLGHGICPSCFTLMSSL